MTRIPRVVGKDFRCTAFFQKASFMPTGGVRMRHILRFDTNKYRPMSEGELIQGHIADASCWCQPYVMMAVTGGAPVYIHQGHFCARSKRSERAVVQANGAKCQRPW